MKVLFAVSNDNVSSSIIKKYQEKYKEIITSKNVYYFNAIIKELQKDKSYDVVVIGEDLEPISNNNYDTIDKFIFEKLDNISDEAYKNTGEDIYFDIQVTNDDPTSAAGICTMVFKGCNVDGGVLAAFDVDGDFLEQEIDFTFEDFANPTKFTQLAGMQ